MDTKRLLLFVIFSFSIMMLWEAWQRDHTLQRPVAAPPAVSVPGAPPPTTTSTPASAPQETLSSIQKGQRIRVRTDVIEAEIDTTGGDLRRLVLLKYLDSDDKRKDFVLLDDTTPPKVYIAQSGLIGNGLPNHKTVFSTPFSNYTLQAGQDKLEVRLGWNDGQGLAVDKVYTFSRGSYVVEVSFEIHNGGATPLVPSVYYQILHDNESAKASRMMPTYTGAAYFTEADKYKKVSFDDMMKSNLSKNATDGWIGLVQHYFVSVWISGAGPREYYTKQLSEHVFAIGEICNLGNIVPGASLDSGAKFYAGPQEQVHLKSVAPGLEYTVDYGWLTVIATPLFWVLSKIQSVVHNWGVAIILLTMLIKLAFYPLSAASYRSMAQMRELAPRLQKMKEQFGDDRQKLHQAMMELYKKEKINPMGGCLPILVQIPVFIALYWVLLNSVEMRQAPFIFWIQDLSAVDPYYVLPILMGITMIIQTKLNPKPPDPIQARVMTVMPIVFSVFFFFFPAGLVLYWLVNNVLSIAQQWHINRTIGKHGKQGNAKG